MRAFFAFISMYFLCLCAGDESVLSLNSPNDVDALFAPKSPLFVKFYAPWCGHCKALAPTWAKLATSMKDAATLVLVDCTVEDHNFCTSFGIRSFPTLKMIVGDKVYSYTGQRNEDDLVKFIKGGYSSAESAPVPRRPATASDYMDASGKILEIEPGVATALEQAPGLLPHPQEVAFPAQPLHPTLKGTPGPSPAMGPNDAPVKVFIWSDFQCPNCRRAAEPLKWLVYKYPNEVQIIFKQLPLEMHKKAKPAALATHAAGKQLKFWEYHDLLWKTRKINAEDLPGHAEKLGLDMAKWNKDRESQITNDEIAYDMSLAAGLEITGTPGLVINGRVSRGWGSVNGLDSTIKSVMKQIETLRKNGVAKDKLAYESTKLADKKIANLIWGISDEKEEL